MNVASVAGLVDPSAGHTLYGASKSFLIRFSESLAAEQHGTGHALLEKFTQPYKAITAHAVLLVLDALTGRSIASDPIRYLDGVLAGQLLEGRLFTAPAHLSPLPLMGLEGWWEGPQDEAFYADRAVFRPLPVGRNPSPVFRL